MTQTEWDRHYIHGTMRRPATSEGVAKVKASRPAEQDGGTWHDSEDQPLSTSDAIEAAMFVILAAVIGGITALAGVTWLLATFL